jgi:threonine/homoserine/homoserine lactone efflux protein
VDFMLETIAQLGIGFVVALSGALIPGPMLAFVVAKSASFGERAGFFAAVGHALVEVVILALIAAGLGFVLASTSFQTFFGVLGGVLLVVLSLFTFVKLRAKTPKLSSAALGYHPVVGGIIFSTVLNPSVFIWWATVGFAMLMEAVLVASFAGVALWLVGHFMADIAWFSSVSYLVAKGRWSKENRAQKYLLATFGCMLLIFGFYFLIKYGLQI